MKKYLFVEVIRHDGIRFMNHLKLSEAHFISQLAQDNKSLTVTLAKCKPETYKFIFG